MKDNKIIFIIIGLIIISMHNMISIKLIRIESSNTIMEMAKLSYSLGNYIDSLKISKSRINLLESKIDSITTKPIKKTTNNSYLKNHYSSKSLPSRLLITDGWIEVCGTKYNPVLSQCISTVKTSTGRSIKEMLNDSDYLCIAVTRKILKTTDLKMKDTVDIQYMDNNGNWNYMVRNGHRLKGYIEDRMGPKVNDFYCIDILIDKSKMNELPFNGLAKIRIKK